MTLDLHTDSPEAYLAEACPMDLANAIHALAEWDDLSSRVADYLFNAWTLTHCMRPDDREGLDDLEYTLNLALDRPSPALREAWHSRWSAYRDLLHNRARLYGGASDVEALLARKHVVQVLSELARMPSETQQSRLRETLGVSHERLSQVLRQMEGRGLISRRRQGRENLVELSESGRRYLPAQPLGVNPAGREGMSNPAALDAWLQAA
jgi:hypothetical protein